MGESYSVGPGGSVSGGRFRAGGPVGVWQQLTVAAHERYVPVAQNAPATDAATTVTATAIPAKLWQTPFLSDAGKLYYFGGMHSDYPGNDIDVCDLNAISGTSMPWQQINRPRVPPAGDPGYGSGGTNSLYKNYGTALADKSDWQPYARHYYCGALVHPVHGLLMEAGYPVDPETGLYSTTTWPGSGYPKGSGDHWADGRGMGIVKYDEATNKYSLFTPGIAAISTSSEWHLSDYCSFIDGFLLFDSESSGALNVYECSNRSSNELVAKYSISTADSGLVGSNAVRQEGTVVRKLSNWLWLVLHKQGDTGLQVLKTYNHGDGVASGARFTNVPLPSGTTAIAGGNFAVAVDRSGNRVFFCELTAGGVPNFYVSNFDTLGAWTALSFTGTPSVSYPYGSVTSAIGREILIYWNNQLFLIGYASGELRFFRVILDGGVAP